MLNFYAKFAKIVLNSLTSGLMRLKKYVFLKSQFSKL